MNDKVFSSQFDALFGKVKKQLPKDLTSSQFQEIALYAASKLQEAKEGKKKEKITFNPEYESGVNPAFQGKSPANVSYLKYKLGNRKRK